MEQQSSSNLSIVAELNQLIEINKYRTEEYKLAISATRDPALKSVFERYCKQSVQFTKTLSTWLMSYGQKLSDAVHRPTGYDKVVAKLKSFLPRPGREEILQACEYREAVAMGIYKKILSLHRLPYEAFLEVRRQKEHIEKAFREMITLSDPAALTY